jgi:hypothetical protein
MKIELRRDFEETKNREYILICLERVDACINHGS